VGCKALTPTRTHSTLNKRHFVCYINIIAVVGTVFYITERSNYSSCMAVKNAAVDCVTVLVSVKTNLMTLNHQHLALSFFPTATATDRNCCRELLSFLMVVTCIFGAITLSCHLLPGEVVFLPEIYVSMPMPFVYLVGVDFTVTQYL